MRAPSVSPRSGLSVVEIAISIAIVLALAGVVAGKAGGMVEQERIAKTLQLIEQLRAACERHQHDTGSYACEYAGYSARYQQLSSAQRYAGWQGPYLASPLSPNANPFGGSIHLFQRIADQDALSGFDLDGDGVEDAQAAANFLWLAGMPRTAAQAIDAAIDGELPGLWSQVGRVRYDASTRSLYALIYR